MSPTSISAEAAAFDSVVFSKTTSRSALSYLTRISMEVEYQLEDDEDTWEAMLWLTERPLSKKSETRSTPDYIFSYEALGKVLGEKTTPVSELIDRFPQISHAYLEGFFSALISMPPLIMPAGWIPVILDILYGNEPERPSMETLNERVGVLMTIYNHVAMEVSNPQDGWLPAYLHGPNGSALDFISGYSAAMFEFNRMQWLEFHQKFIVGNRRYQGFDLLLSDVTAVRATRYHAIVRNLHVEVCDLFRVLRGF
ncbi:MAG: UPF0149 family protein [bacterium]|nr:UPF0149 family protein [bacterium]